MKIVRIAAFLSVMLLVAQSFAAAESPAEKSFGQLRTLIGNWDGKNSAGTPLEVSFRETSAGSALLSAIHVGSSNTEDMVSVFHLDGDRLMLTHYCTAGNQPRMTSRVSPDGKTITFDFLDATNLAHPDDGHMWRVVIAMLDANHHTETWVYIDHGKRTAEVYDLRRSSSTQN